MAVCAQCALRSARAAVTRAMVPTSPDSGSPHSSRSFWRRILAASNVHTYYVLYRS